MSPTIEDTHPRRQRISIIAEPESHPPSPTPPLALLPRCTIRDPRRPHPPRTRSPPPTGIAPRRFESRQSRRQELHELNRLAKKSLSEQVLHAQRTRRECLAEKRRQDEQEKCRQEEQEKCRQEKQRKRRQDEREKRREEKRSRPYQHLVAELQHIVAATQPAIASSPPAYVLTLPTLGPVFTTTLLLADVPLRYFYLYYRGGWDRFAFQGSIDDFQQAIAQHSPPPPPPPTTLRYRPRAVGSVACHIMHPNNTPARRPLLPADRIMDTAPLPPASNKSSHLMRWPAELRDLVYEYCVPESFVVHARGRPVFVTSAALATANSQIRTCFRDRLYARRARLPAMVFFEPHSRQDWSEIFRTYDNETYKARVCIELDAIPDWNCQNALWHQMRQDIPELSIRHVTFVLLSGVHACAGTNARTLGDRGRHPINLIRVVSKLDLTLFETGQSSGFAVYFCPIDYDHRTHLLRSDDWPGYLSLLYSFASPTAGDHILKSLLWHKFPVSYIDATEQEALRRELLDRPADNAAMAILPW